MERAWLYSCSDLAQRMARLLFGYGMICYGITSIDGRAAHELTGFTCLAA